MIVKIGTANLQKVKAVREVFSQYPELAESTFLQENIKSGVDEQPKTLVDTVQGAFNRAVTAKLTSDLGVGIESGIMNSPLGKLNFTAVVLAETAHERGPGFEDLWEMAPQRGIHFGHSSGFQLPRQISQLVYREKMGINTAVHKLGLTDNPKIGNSPQGFLGLLTDGRITRADYTAMGLHMALISYRKPELFA